MQDPRSDVRLNRRALLRGLTAAATLAAGSAILAACGGAPPAPTTAPAKPAEQPKPTEAAKPAAAAAPTSGPAAQPAAGAPAAASIRYHCRTGQEVDLLNERLPEFKQKTGIDVKIEHFPGGDYYQKMQTLISGDQMGDVLWMALGVGWPIWAATSLLSRLDDFVASEKYDLSVFYKAGLDMCYQQGKLFGIPFKLQPGQMGLYYNVNQFKAAGVKEPSLTTTLDELIDTAKALTKTSGKTTEQYGFLPWFYSGDNGGGWQHTVNWARAFGAELTDEEGKKSLLTDSKFKESVRWLHNLVFKLRYAPSFKEVTSNDPDLMFVAGGGSMFQSGSWTKGVPQRIKDKFEVKCTLMPKGPGGKRGSMAIVDVIGINAKTKAPKESWELTKFLCDKEHGIQLGEKIGTCGGRKDVFTDPRLLAQPLHAVWPQAVEQAEAARFAGNFRTAEYSQALWQKIGVIWLGDEQPDDKFFNDLNATMQQVLDLPRA